MSAHIEIVRRIAQALAKDPNGATVEVSRPDLTIMLHEFMQVAWVEQEYLDAIDAEAIKRGYIAEGESLVSETGPNCWLGEWFHDPTLTPEEQVADEIQAAAESLG